jgi:alpha-L-fucosidase
MGDSIHIVEAHRAGLPVQPTAAQLRWLDLGFGLAFHYGINTFHDLEASDGSLDPASFNPVRFDPEHWPAAARAAGARYLLLVTKHLDGFCMWPTRQTDYSVQASPCRRDILGEVIGAARRAGLKVALYYSFWEMREPSYRDGRAYASHVKRQLTELLTAYGEIAGLWFDGLWEKSGIDYFDAERTHWREIHQHVKTLQPDCLVGVNPTTHHPGKVVLWPCDFRIGEKATPPDDDRNVYYYDGPGCFLPWEGLFSLSEGGTKQGLFADGKWFWHSDDRTCRSPEWVLDRLRESRRRAANLVLNTGPDRDGRLREVDLDCLRSVGRALQAEPAILKADLQTRGGLEAGPSGGMARHCIPPTPT